MNTPQKFCAWCREPIALTARRDRKTCSQPCRQALHRFRIAPAPPPDGSPRHFAYADPPYPGCAKRYYKMPEVDHAALALELDATYPDGWALSTSAAAAPDVCRQIPGPLRLAIWCRACRRPRRFGPHNAFEVLLIRGGRPRHHDPKSPASDVLTWSGRQHTHPKALVGMKPAAFCEWMFHLLGAVQGDTLTDIFTGSGAVARAWDQFQNPVRTRQLPSRLEESRGARRV